MLIYVITVSNICVCTYICMNTHFLVNIWTFHMASLNLGNTCKAHITFCLLSVLLVRTSGRGQKVARK